MGEVMAMALSEFSLFLANRIQEKGTVPIAFLAERYGKSPSTVRRCIADLNEFLPPPKRFVTTDAAVTPWQIEDGSGNPVEATGDEQVE